MSPISGSLIVRNRLQTSLDNSSLMSFIDSAVSLPKLVGDVHLKTACCYISCGRTFTCIKYIRARAHTRMLVYCGARCRSETSCVLGKPSTLRVPRAVPPVLCHTFPVCLSWEGWGRESSYFVPLNSQQSWTGAVWSSWAGDPRWAEELGVEGKIGTWSDFCG